MAGSTIGAASLVLSTNAAKLYDGLKQAGGKVKGWADQTKKDVSGKLAGIGKGGFGFGMAAGAGMAVFSAITGAISGVIGKFGELKERIDHAAKASRALGIDTATYQGLEHAAELSGVKTEQLGEALNKLRATTAGPLDEALYDLADRFQGLEDPAARARLLVSKFGESGLKLAGMFEGGRDGLKGLVEEAQKLGFALSDADAAKIEQANDAITRVKRSVEGLFNRILIALAPAIEVAAKNFQAVLEIARPVFDTIGKAIQAVASKLEPFYAKVREGIKTIAEKLSPIFDKLTTLVSKWWEYVTEVFGKIWAAAEQVWQKIGEKAGGVLDWIQTGLDYLIRAFDAAIPILLALWDEVLSVVVNVISQIIDWISQAIEWLGQWIGETFKFAEGWGTVEEIVVGAFKLIGKAGAYAWDTIKAGVGAVANAIGFIVEKVFTRVVDAFHALVSLAKELPDAIRPDWVDDFVDGVGRARDAVKAGGVGLQDWGKRQIDQWGNSAKAVDEWFAKIGKKRVAEANKQAEVQKRAMAAMGETPKYNAVGAALKGSKEENSILARWQTENMLNPQLDVQRKQLQEQQKANEALKQVIEAVKGINIGFGIF